MDRVMTVEERIRRAEEIYERRKKRENITEQHEKNNSIESKDIERKKDIKLLKKIIIQLITCLVIYFIFYTIQNNEYIFSKEFLTKANEILSYDMNFREIFENVKNNAITFVNKNKQENNNQNQEGIGGAEVKTNIEINKNENQEEIQEKASQELNEEEKRKENTEQQVQTLSQEEQDIQNVKNTTTFIKPIEGKITSSFGRREEATGRVPKNHTGTDIAANMGTKIKSSTDGEVVLASDEGDYGKHLKIQIGEVSIIYAHCNALYVKQGDKVFQGQEIAEVGSTGNSTGPHLHFEIRISERIVNPQNILEL